LDQQVGRLSLGEASADNFDFYATLQSDVTVMQSDTLALQVGQELGLFEKGEFAFRPRIKTAQAIREKALPIEAAPLKRAAFLNEFKSHLNVEIIPGSRLIAVSYKSSDPDLAAKIVNRLVSDFVDYDFRVRYDATLKATDFLSRQLLDLKAEVANSQLRAVELQKASGMLGADESDNLVSTRLEQLNNDLAAAEATRVTKEAIYNLARDGNPEVVAGLLGSSSGSNIKVQSHSAGELLTHLKQQDADLNVQYAQALAQYGPAYPTVVELRQEISAVQLSIGAELTRQVEIAKAEYELALSEEATARKRFADQQAIAAKVNDQSIAYTIAKNEADSNRVLYDNLLKKLKEASILAGLRSTDLNVVDPAIVPGSPSRPSMRAYLGVGLLAGLVLGVIGAFVLDAMDDTVRDPQQIEASVQRPLMGVIPQAAFAPDSDPEKWLTAYTAKPNALEENESDSDLHAGCVAITEAFRWVRSSLLLLQPGERPSCIMVASAVSQEGKSFCCLNLAAALAQNSTSVLLADSDLRRGNLSRLVGFGSDAGLSEVLRGQITDVPYRRIASVNGLAFLPAGATLSSPAELLGSEAMAKLIESWRKQFSYIVIDTPPLLPVVDALVLSPFVDSLIFVARSGFTQRASMLRAVRLLRNAGVRNLRVLVNAVDASSPEYSQYYGQYGYQAYSGSRSQSPRTD
jgi:capsular exopolysaccharide synthesis family protein